VEQAMTKSKPRIVIYGTGYYGGLMTRIALEKGWTVVAAFNRAGPKVGQDLGRIAGLGRDIGVVVQDCDTASYDNLDADIGIVVQTNVLSVNFPAYRRLMNAGLNVICHGTQAYYPWGCNATLAAEIDALAKKNKVTFTGAGIWDMSRIWSGILLLGPCTEIKSIFHSSITDMKGQATKEQSVQFGVTLTVEQYYEKGLNQHPLFPSYTTVPEHVLAAVGYTITSTRTVVEPIVWDEPFESEFMECTIPAGRVVGTRTVGEVETKEGVSGRIEFEGRLFKPGEIEHMFWSVDGLPRTRVRVEREDSDHATAASLINRIPQVIAAQPGIVLISKLGPLQHTVLVTD
jgi:2,4-diaminopentanoate dehydrogenase